MNSSQQIHNLPAPHSTLHAPSPNPSPRAPGECFSAVKTFPNSQRSKATPAISSAQRFVQGSSRRPAKSLVEALVIISLLSVVVGLSTTTLATLFRVRRQTQIDSEQRASLHRLAIRFRADAHDSVGVTLRGDAQTDPALDFKFSDGRTIHYAFTSPSITRQVLQDSAILHHDTFRLSRSIDVTFEKPENEPALIRLLIRPAESHLPPRDTPRTATIEAAVGQNTAVARIARSP
jgi:hypothetical protein